MSTGGPVVVLAGGTGGARLARGLLEHVGDRLVVIANTGDDVEVYGARVCPDPDLVIFQLADRIDPRGWGLLDDTFNAMDQLEQLGAECWFRLGDRDLAIGIERSRLLAAGIRLSDAIASLAEAFGVVAKVLPMTDVRVATFIHSDGRRLPFQEFMILERAEAGIDSVEFEGIADAVPTAEALTAIEQAEAIIIGPSNPAISIDPILAVPGMREALVASPAPVVCVSPLVGGRSVKGPTERFLEAAGIGASPAGIASHYGDLVDVMVADEDAGSVPTRVCDVLMDGPAGQARVAAETLAAASGIAR